MSIRQKQAADFIRDETIVSALAYGSRLARDRKKVLAILERAGLPKASARTKPLCC